MKKLIKLSETDMKEQFCSYEIALKLKELGFDEPCFGSYFSNKSLWIEDEIDFTALPQGVEYSFDAPLWQQVEQWFRDKYNIHITILKGNYSNNEINNQLCYYYSIPGKLGMCYNRYNTYEEAREQAILKALELCLNKK